MMNGISLLALGKISVSWDDELCNLQQEGDENRTKSSPAV